jgi:type I restriction enzyme S subunit
MSESQMVKLGDHVDILTGFPFTSRDYTDDGVRLLRGDNIAQGKLRWESARCWPNSLLTGVEPYLLAPGDVVLAMDRPWISAGLKYAHVRWDDVPSLLVQRVARLRSRDGLDQAFLRFLIGSPGFTDHVLSVQTGTAVPHISAEQIREFTFALPTLRDQHAAGEVLGALDDKIDANARLARVCEELAVAHVAAAPRQRSIGELVTMSRNQLRPEQFASELVEHFSLPAFDEGRMPERCAGTAIKSNKFQVRGPAVLVSKLNPHIPRVWYAEPSYEQTALASTEFVILEPTAECMPTVLWAACAGSEFTSAVAERVTGTTGSHQRVTPQDVLDTVAPDVTALSVRAQEFVDGLVLRALAARRESEVLAQIQNALLPSLISGELRVRDAESLVGEAV